MYTYLFYEITGEGYNDEYLQHKNKFTKGQIKEHWRQAKNKCEEYNWEFQDILKIMVDMFGYTFLEVEHSYNVFVDL